MKPEVTNITCIASDKDVHKATAADNRKREAKEKETLLAPAPTAGE